MKALFLIALCALSLNVQKVKAESSYIDINSDLFAERDYNNRRMTADKIHQQNLDKYAEFVSMDVNDFKNASDDKSRVAAIDTGKVRYISKKDAQVVLAAANENPVVSLYLAEKEYDPKNLGIGFCFGRATFINRYLVQSGVSRANVKKAFVVGPMSRGAWGWHVTTIVESRDSKGNEIWLTIDPVAGKIMEVSEWYNYWRTSASDDKKLRLYITDAGKFGAGGYSTYDQDSFSDEFYNGYFDDMETWFQTKYKKSDKLSF